MFSYGTRALTVIAAEHRKAISIESSARTEGEAYLDKAGFTGGNVVSYGTRDLTVIAAEHRKAIVINGKAYLTNQVLTKARVTGGEMLKYGTRALTVTATSLISVPRVGRH